MVPHECGVGAGGTEEKRLRGITAVVGRRMVQGSPRLRSGQALHCAARFRAALFRMTSWGAGWGSLYSSLAEAEASLRCIG